jgi:lipopolysaccharide biosynthesis glycosyltransferase
MPYASIPPWSSYFDREIYYKLEVFNPRGFDRIVYLDCDTVILDDISALWDPGQLGGHALYAVRERPEMGVTPDRFGKFNLGVMVVNRPLLDRAVHQALLGIAQRGFSDDGTDQGVIEQYLIQHPDATVGELDDSYNVMVVARKYGDWERLKNRIKILHFVNHAKPWAPDHVDDHHFDAELKRIWDDAYRMALP